MVKRYDFEKAKSIVESRKDEIIEASLGMYEDWFWTAETVYENGKWKRTLKKGDKIAGIDGSYWATPALMIQLKNGETECYPCYTGKGSRDMPPFPMSFGVLSGPVQDRMPPLRFDYERKLKEFEE